MTFTAFCYCTHCGKIIQPQGTKCPQCHQDCRIEAQHEHFLPSESAPQSTAATITSGVTLLDRFRIGECLGNERSGDVYLAKDQLRSMDVALKVVAVGPISSDTEVLQLQRELMVQRRISDFTNVVRVNDLHVVPWGGTALLLVSMEYAEGGSFRKWMTAHSRDWETRKSLGLHFFKQACHGVGVIHNANAVHFDLRPENLFFSQGILKVSGLGAARFSGCQGPSRDLNRDSSEFVTGPSPYMRPDLPDDIEGVALDAGDDMYALGIILYELLHPDCMPPANFPAGTRNFHQAGLLPGLSEIDDRLADIINRCLEKNPADRYVNAWGLLDDLNDRKGITHDHELPTEDNPGKNSTDLATTWEAASLCYAQGDFTEANRLTEAVLQEQPDHAHARQLLAELSARFDQADEFYREINQRLEGGDLSEMVGLLLEAADIYPGHPAGVLVQAKLEVRARQYRTGMENGFQALKGGNWRLALDFFRQALRVHPNATHLKQIVGLLSQIEDQRHHINQAVIQGNSQKALALAQSVDLQVEQMTTRHPALSEPS